MSNAVERDVFNEALADAERHRHRADNAEARAAQLAEEVFSERDRAERAEADNAALSKHIDWTCNLLSLGQIERAVSYLRKAANHEHPGAALLEYVWALEKVRGQLRDDVSAGCIRLVDECRKLHEACVAADALKGKP